MRSLPLRGDGLGDELIFGHDFVLGFLLLEHNKHCAPPCAIQISPLYASKALEEKEEICICTCSVPRVTQSFPTHGVINRKI